jgi:DNA-binding XRE family transcriptional regulator
MKDYMETWESVHQDKIGNYDVKVYRSAEGIYFYTVNDVDIYIRARKTPPDRTTVLQAIHNYCMLRLPRRSSMREAREAAGLTQLDVADIIGCKVQQYQRWESGAQTPSVWYGRCIANALGVSMDEIF